MKQRSKFAIAWLVLPGVLLFGSFVLLIVINLIFNPTFWMIPDGEPIDATPLVITIFNGTLLTTGAIGLITLIPGLAVGLILMNRNKRSIHKATTI